MRFASWNIAGGHTFSKSLEDGISYDGENLDYFIDELKKANADIIVLQESHTPIDEREISQGKIIADALGFSLAGNHPYMNPSHIKPGNQLSLAVMSRYPVVETSFHKVPNPHLTIMRPNGDVWKTYDYGLLNCVLNMEGTPINITDGHLVPLHYFKRDFAEPEFQPVRDDIENFFQTLSEQPTIVGCDFNYNDIQKLFPQIFENDLYRETFTGEETTPGRGQQDHILISKNWNIIKTEIRKVHADHLLCLADVELT